MISDNSTHFGIAENRQIERMEDGNRHFCDELLAKEEEYILFINDLDRTHFFCSPLNLEELAVGYAFIEGLISEKEEIASIRISEKEQSIFLYRKEINQNKQAIISDAVSLSCESIFQLWRSFDEACVNFRLTGGLHAVALCSQQSVLFIKEDIARHIALLKVLGSALLDGIPLEDKCLFFSGRISAQMVTMIAKTNLKIILCHGAATLGAVTEAQVKGITLAGFIRNQYMNLYTGNQRIEGDME